MHTKRHSAEFPDDRVWKNGPGLEQHPGVVGFKPGPFFQTLSLWALPESVAKLWCVTCAYKRYLLIRYIDFFIFCPQCGHFQDVGRGVLCDAIEDN